MLPPPDAGAHTVHPSIAPVQSAGLLQGVLHAGMSVGVGVAVLVGVAVATLVGVGVAVGSGIVVDPQVPLAVHTGHSIGH